MLPMYAEGDAEHTCKSSKKWNKLIPFTIFPLSSLILIWKCFYLHVFSPRLMPRTVVFTANEKGWRKRFWLSHWNSEFRFNKFPSHVDARIGGGKIVVGEKLIIFKSDKILYENVKGLTRRYVKAEISVGKIFLSAFRNYFFLLRHHEDIKF